MSDHPGLCTFQAESAQAIVHRLVVIMFADDQVSMQAAKEIFVQALDLVVQVGLLGGKRRIPGVCEIQVELKAEDAVFRQVYRYGDGELGRIGRKRG
jgi:pilus assembly protein CpaF